MSKGMIVKELVNYYALEAKQIDRALNRLVQEEVQAYPGTALNTFAELYDRLETDLAKYDCLYALYTRICQRNTGRLQ